MSDNQVPHGSMPPEDPDKEESQEEEKEVKPTMDYEKSYGELQSKFGEQSNEIGALRQQAKDLQSQIAETEKVATEREEAARNTAPPTDYEQMIRDVAKKYDDGDISYEDSLLESNRITREMSLAEAESDKTAMLEQARSEVQQMLSDKDAEVVVNDFYKENPEFAKLQESGRLKDMAAADPLLDDLAAFYKLKSEENFEAGKAEAARLASGSEKAAKVLADSGASMQAQARPVGEAAIKASMRAALKG